jgi:hypothetical protein
MKRAVSIGACAAALAIALLAPGRAAAFSNSDLFAAKDSSGQPQPGGGLGRFFTGSPADGYTCKVCHHGGQGPTLRILGLPLSGYQPNTQYEVTVDWPDNFLHIALALEITNQAGVAAGKLELPPENQLRPYEGCQPPLPAPAPAISAGQLVNPPPTGRQIIQMPDCSAQQLRFWWTAPALDVGPVWLAGAVVSSDTSTTPQGDGVTEFSHVISSPTSPSTPASDTTGGCNVALPKRTQSTDWSAAAFALTTCAFGLRLRRRRATRAS